MQSDRDFDMMVAFEQPKPPDLGRFFDFVSRLVYYKFICSLPLTTFCNFLDGDPSRISHESDYGENHKSGEYACAAVQDGDDQRISTKI